QAQRPRRQARLRPLRLSCFPLRYGQQGLGADLGQRRQSLWREGNGRLRRREKIASANAVAGIRVVFGDSAQNGEFLQFSDRTGGGNVQNWHQIARQSRVT